MKAHNMPTSVLPVGKLRVLVADSDINSASTLAQSLRTKGDYDVQTVRSTFETGVTASKFTPHVLLINLFAEGIVANDICQNIRDDEDLQTIKIIALANKLSDSESAALLLKGFDGYISDPADINKVVEEIEKATAIVY